MQDGLYVGVLNMDYAEWIAQAEASPEYARERFHMPMAVRYRREEWRRTVIREAKTRRLNNLYKNIGRSYSAYARWEFEVMR